MTSYITYKRCIKYISPWTVFELTTFVVIGTDCTCSCKSNYHTITTTTAPDMNSDMISGKVEDANKKGVIISRTIIQDSILLFSNLLNCTSCMPSFPCLLQGLWFSVIFHLSLFVIYEPYTNNCNHWIYIYYVIILFVTVSPISLCDQIHQRV